MNTWTQKSIDLAIQKDYLDQLYQIYPMSVNVNRKLSTQTITDLTAAYDRHDGRAMLKILLKQEIFPIKDSYVAYFKKDPAAIDRNPALLQRLTNILFAMELDDIIARATIPKETNRQIGPLFKRWVGGDALGIKTTDSPATFMSSPTDIIFNASDAAMKQLAREHLGYTHDKGLDFIAKVNDCYIIAEAKFLTDIGGHQNAQFNDAITTMQTTLATDKPVRAIAILDGVLYIKSKGKMHTAITTGFADDKVIVSAVLLKDYLASL